jgi:hypothetical protein
MTQKEQAFIVDVVVINPTWETVILSVINQPTSVAMKLNVITNIQKYRQLHEEHHFIPMAT